MASTATSAVRFAVQDSMVDDGGWEVVPMIGAESLVDIVRRYEERRGYEPAGGYGGIDSRALSSGMVADYYRGFGRSYASARGAGFAKRLLVAALRERAPLHGRVTLLACDGCGGQACWPLEAAVTTSADVVTWSGFRNPHRRGWDYDELGPFVFERTQYEGALADLAGTGLLGEQAS